MHDEKTDQIECIKYRKYEQVWGRLYPKLRKWIKKTKS